MNHKSRVGLQKVFVLQIREIICIIYCVVCFASIVNHIAQGFARMAALLDAKRAHNVGTSLVTQSCRFRWICIVLSCVYSFSYDINSLSVTIVDRLVLAFDSQT